MSLTPGMHLGPYEILSPLGAGGMGEVFRARDTKLGRDVALKILPEAFTTDAERLARFRREAQVLASLNHAHIAQIFGIEDSTAVHALVMELVDGEDLSAIIARGPMPLEQALPIAAQIAAGLEAAHDAGVVHRDLKPANIKVRPDGTVKILDFGLAKAVESTLGASAVNLSLSPTLTSPAQMTSAGVILGTAAYMSPEQAKGRPVDKRTDVWAFGAVLYEMLTGRPCFRGDDVSEVFASVLREPLDWSALPPGLPPAIVRLVRRCLARDVRSRLSDMAMVRLELRDAGSEPAAIAAAAPPPPAPRSAVRRAAPYVAAIVAAAVTGAVVWRVRQPADVPRPLARFSIALPDEGSITSAARAPVAISPDGTRLVVAARQRLYIRGIDQLEATPIAGTELGGTLGFARAPFFSPDGQWIGFWQQNQLRKAPVGGGAPVTICELPGAPLGVSWETDGRILVGMGSTGIHWVPDAGGTAATFVEAKGPERVAFPQLLPGGEWLLLTLFRANESVEQGQAVAVSIKSGERRVLVSGVREARYLRSGHLLFARGNALLAQPFDLKQLAVSGGGPVPVVEGVANAASTTPAAYYAVSDTGALAYVPGSGTATAATKLIDIARDGTRKTLAEVPGMAWFPRFSPDGTRLAYAVSVGPDLSDASDLWVLDVQRGARTRVTFSGNNRFYPIWTRDGTRLTHADGSNADNRVRRTLADGSGVSETLLEPGRRWFPTSWSPDGRVLAIYLNGPTNTRDVAMLTMEGERRVPEPFVATPFEERGAIFSPDGRWIAYVSNKTGQNDVFARPFPGPGTEVTVSAGGGQEPVWGPSGRELFYRQGGALQVVRIDVAGTTMKVGAPVKVFDDNLRSDTGGASGGMANYDIAPDGKRFVMIEEPRASTPSNTKVNVVLNWGDELKRRVR